MRYLRDMDGSVPDHHNKVTIPKVKSHERFHFPIHVNVMVTLYYSLLTVQQTSKKGCTYLN